MIIKQQDVKIGDVLLMAKNTKLTVIKIIGITKSGSLKYSHSSNAEGRDYYGQGLELNPDKHDKVKYIQKGWTSQNVPAGTYDQYFWLIDRPDN